jgi:hypothetical protein
MKKKSAAGSSLFALWEIWSYLLWLFYLIEKFVMVVLKLWSYVSCIALVFIVIVSRGFIFAVNTYWLKPGAATADKSWLILPTYTTCPAPCRHGFDSTFRCQSAGLVRSSSRVRPSLRPPCSGHQMPSEHRGLFTPLHGSGISSNLSSRRRLPNLRWRWPVPFGKATMCVSIWGSCKKLLPFQQLCEFPKPLKLVMTIYPILYGVCAETNAMDWQDKGARGNHTG